MRTSRNLILVLLAGFVITSGITGMRTLRELHAGRSIYLKSDNLRMEDVLKTIGTTPDSRLYIYGSYLLYQHRLFSISRDGFRVNFCERPLQSIVFLPFIPSGKYMPILTILVLTILFPLSLILLAHTLSRGRLDKRISLAVLIAILFGSFYATRLLLDGWVSILLALWIALTIKRRTLLSTGTAFLLSVLRPEFVILFIILLIINEGKSIRLITAGAAIISISAYIFVSKECGDQSHFFEWTIQAYGQNVAGEFDRSGFEEKVKRCIIEGRKEISEDIHPRKIERDCFRETTLEVLEKENPLKLFIIATGNIVKNAFDLAFNFTINNRLNRKATFPIVFLLTIIYDLIFISSSIKLWRSKKYRFLFALWMMLLLIYSAYYPFGLANPSRWKTVLFPVEISIIALSTAVEQEKKGP